MTRPANSSPGAGSLYITEDEAIYSWEDGEVRQDITPTADPAEVLDFMQKIVDTYEARAVPRPDETDVDPREALPLYAEVEDSGFVYIRDTQGGEYVMWSVNEWVAPRPDVDDFADWNRSDIPVLEDDRTGINENVIGAVLNAIRKAYEDPEYIMDTFDRVQIEACDT